MLRRARGIDRFRLFDRLRDEFIRRGFGPPHFRPCVRLRVWVEVGEARDEVIVRLPRLDRHRARASNHLRQGLVCGLGTAADQRECHK